MACFKMTLKSLILFVCIQTLTGCNGLNSNTNSDSLLADLNDTEIQQIDMSQFFHDSSGVTTCQAAADGTRVSCVPGLPQPGQEAYCTVSKYNENGTTECLEYTVKRPISRCSLQASKSSLGVNESFNYIISAPAEFGLVKYLFSGTKNGVVDETDVNYGAFSSDRGYLIDLKGNNAAAGTYTRHYKGYDASGKLICQSNDVVVKITPSPTLNSVCTLSVSKSTISLSSPAPLNSFNYIINVNSIGKPAVKYLFSGTKNGVVDETNANYGPFNAIQGYFLDLSEDNSSIIGEYTRSFSAYDEDGNKLCSSNKVNVSILP